jgi:hypothetical protein
VNSSLTLRPKAIGWKLQVMRIARAALTDQAGLSCDERAMGFASQAKYLCLE